MTSTTDTSSLANPSLSAMLGESYPSLIIDPPVNRILAQGYASR